ncbi:MAG TPA: glycosyltransferase family 2 protein [Thermotogota bacterium]|nr:glycosyltransferase family 2 protein [Thermotogota bacterium]
MPKVSILIPVYDRKELIGETVDSALAQTYSDFEVVISDNCSTDGTWEVLQTYAEKDDRVKVFRNERNIGPVRNWKRCIDEARGEYGKILWSDDLIAPNFLEKTLPYLDSDPGAGFVFTAAEIFSEEDSHQTYILGDSSYRVSEEFIGGALINNGRGKYPVSPGCALFRLSDLRKSLLVDIPNKIGSDFSKHAIGNDLLLFLLTAHRYPRFAYVSDILSFFRKHEGSISCFSQGEKLAIHYNLAKAYFVENYRKDLLSTLNVKLFLYYLRHIGSHKVYNFHDFSDYYFLENSTKVNWFRFFPEVIRGIVRKLVRIFR